MQLTEQLFYIFMKNKKKIILIIIAAFFFLFLVLYLPIMGNYWGNSLLLIMDPVYIIPKESSKFNFNPTVMNPGSGDWWIYGEDNKNYYYFNGDKKTPYIFIAKKKSKQCNGFNAHDNNTWCVD